MLITMDCGGMTGPVQYGSLITEALKKAKYSSHICQGTRKTEMAGGYAR